MLLRDFVEKYHHHIWPTGGDHAKLQLQRMRHVMNGLGEDMLITDVRMMHIQDFLMTPDCAASTRNQYISAISKVLNYAQQNQLIEHVPPFKGLYDKKTNQRKRVLSETEIDSLKRYFTAVGERWMAHMVTLADQTGLRKGSILEIGRSAQLVEEQGAMFCYIPTQKNGDEVMVPLNNEALHAYREFCRLRSCFSEHAFRRLWDEARQHIAPGDKEFVFHSIRRTTATRLAAQNVSAVIIAQMLGHRSLQTTQKYMMTDRKTQVDTAELLRRSTH